VLYSVVCISPIVIPYLHVIWVGCSLLPGSLSLGSLVWALVSLRQPKIKADLENS